MREPPSVWIIELEVKFTISSLIYGHAFEKTVVAPSVLPIEVEAYQTLKQILSPVHVLLSYIFL